MIRFACLCIICGLVLTIRAAPNTTSLLVHGTSKPSIFVADVVSTTSVAIVSGTNRTKKSSAKHIPGKRKFLITGGEALRSRTRPKKKDYTSLKYIEYNDTGTPLNTVMMYSLSDVSEFFRIYLDTVICHEKCETD